MKRIVGSRLNNSGMGKNRKLTSRSVLKVVLFYQCYFVFYLSLFLFKSVILVKFIYFQLCIRNEQLTLLVILGLPHILTLINIINKRFY